MKQSRWCHDQNTIQGSGELPKMTAVQLPKPRHAMAARASSHTRLPTPALLDANMFMFILGFVS